MSFTNDQLIVTGRKLQVSEATRRRNPDLFGAVARLGSEVAQPNKRREVEDHQLVKGQEGVRYRIAITVFRKRLLDSHDNARSALKATIDIITRALGFTSDDCPQLQWEYHQVKTTGRQGVLINIQTLQ